MHIVKYRDSLLWAVQKTAEPIEMQFAESGGSREHITWSVDMPPWEVELLANWKAL